jgi:hypothetical protein
MAEKSPAHTLLDVYRTATTTITPAYCNYAAIAKLNTTILTITKPGISFSAIQ